jgi:hypothetical protein
MSMPQRLVGFVDPSIQPTDAREARILLDVVRLGLCLHRVHPGGHALRLAGHGCFAMADARDLSTIDALAQAVADTRPMP